MIIARVVLRDGAALVGLAVLQDGDAHAARNLAVPELPDLMAQQVVDALVFLSLRRIHREDALYAVVEDEPLLCFRELRAVVERRETEEVPGRPCE